MPRNDPNKVLRTSASTTVNARDYKMVLADATGGAIALVLISPAGLSEWSIKVANVGSANDVTLSVAGGGSFSFTLPPTAAVIVEQDDLGTLHAFGSVSAGGGSGIGGSGTIGTLPLFVTATTIGNSQITETSGRDNVPVFSGGDYNASFYSAAETGFELTGTVTSITAATTPNGALSVLVNGDENLLGNTGAVIGIYDTRTTGNFGTISSLNLDTIKTSNGDTTELGGLSLFVWNQGNADIGAMQGIRVSLESDDGDVAGNANGIFVGTPSFAGSTVAGLAAALYVEDQTTVIPAGGAFAIYYAAPGSNTFSVAADGHLQVGATITPPATVGAQTINKNAGSVNFAALAASLVVTCDKCTASSIVIATVATNDTTLTSVQAVAGVGSFTLFGNAAATAETRVNFWILNQ